MSYLGQYTHCANCEISFATDGGKCTVAFAVGKGISLYAICGECGSRARMQGLPGIPTVASESRLSANMQRKTQVSVVEDSHVQA